MVCVCCRLAILTTCVSICHIDDGQPHQDETPTVQSVAQSESSRPLFLPAAMTVEERDRYARLLVMSEEQSVFLETLFLRYLEHEEKLRDEYVPDLSILAKEAGAALNDPEAIAAHERLYRKRDQFDNLAMQIEERFLLDLTPVLSEEQLSKLQRIRDLRRRERIEQLLFKSPSARIDLSRQIFRLVQQGMADPPCGDVDDLLKAYEATLSQLRKRYARAFLESVTKTPRLLAGGDKASHNQLGRLMRRANLLLRQISEVNLVYVDVIAQQMGEQGPTLSRIFYEAAFGGVFPDPHDIEPVFRVALDSAPHEDHASLLAAIDDYKVRQEMISRRMIDVTLHEEHRIFATNTLDWATRQEFRSRLDELQRKRAENAELAIRRTLALFYEEIPANLESSIEEYRHRVASDSSSRDMGYAYRPAAVTIHQK